MFEINPYVNVWLIGVVVSIAIFDKMGRDKDEGAKMIRDNMFLLTILWPLVWTLVIVSFIKDWFRKNDNTDTLN